MEELNLGWGNPNFLIPYWKNISLSLPKHVATPYVIGSLPELQEAIKSLHAQEKNAKVSTKHIVVGHGATQILAALLHVINKPVFANPPFFMRFPEIAKIAKVPWKPCPKGLEIITNPNNPDGTVTLKDSKFSNIYDLSYNWEQYTTPLNYDEDIMVFSLSKATGHASTRIGWAIIKDAKLAHDVQDYIEHSSCGVSLEAQLKALAVIKSQLGNPNTCFSYGKKILNNRHRQLERLKLPFKKLNHSGMFLWAQVKWPIYHPAQIFKPKNIIYTSGSLLGGYDDFFRINLGCSEKDFKEFLKRMKVLFP